MTIDLTKIHPKKEKNNILVFAMLFSGTIPVGRNSSTNLSIIIPK